MIFCISKNLETGADDLEKIPPRSATNKCVYLMRLPEFWGFCFSILIYILIMIFPIIRIMPGFN